MTKPRLRELGIEIGSYPVGPHNAITDVAGIAIGHTTLISETPRIARTGVTIIMPRDGEIGRDHCFAGFHSFNGNGEMTGIHWLKESGFLISPIALTSTHSVGVAHQALVEYSSKHGFADMWSLPVVAETYDGYLNDADAFHLTREHVFDAIHNARSGTVSEGNVGGGTGMICHDFKGGIGTSSRVVEIEGSPYTVGVLVQSNYGNRNSLRVDGVHFGRMITPDHTPVPHLKLPTQPEAVSSSIIVILATDAPLLPLQCTRLAQRATVGLSRVGGTGSNGSGDLFLAFSTHNHVVNGARSVQSAAWLPQPHLSRLFEAVADATEESILNALCAAETMTGFKGRIVYELPQGALIRHIR